MCVLWMGVDAHSRDVSRTAPHVRSCLRKPPPTPAVPLKPDTDSISELKRKFKDVLRAYWRQHKANHEGEDTDQYDVAFRIATNIFNLYWDKPNYAGLRGDKKEILNYFVKHIQLSKSREGQTSALLRQNAGTSILASPLAQLPPRSVGFLQLHTLPIRVPTVMLHLYATLSLTVAE